MKTSRVQDCGSMDMSKFGHSQTSKIKSKHTTAFILIFVVDCCVVLICMPHNFIIQTKYSCSKDVPVVDCG